MTFWHSAKRQRYLEQGLCPICSGKEPLLPGRNWGERCRIKQVNDGRRKRGNISPQIVPAKVQYESPTDALERLLDSIDMGLTA